MLGVPLDRFAGGKDAGKLGVIALGPNMVAGAGVNELRGDAERVLRDADSAGLGDAL